MRRADPTPPVTALLAAADLDRTLIYSRGALAENGDDRHGLVAVERREGKDASWLTPGAIEALIELRRHALLVPVTTRTPEQWRRVRLPGPRPRYAITANGGVLLVDGVADPDWHRVVVAELAQAAPLAEVWDHLGHACRPEWTVKLRNARGMFCYAVLHRKRVPAEFYAESAAWADERGWQVSRQGRKLYWVPRTLTKRAAVHELARRTGIAAIAAAGDSLLDVDLFEAASWGIAARHGELVASGWTAPHVTVTRERGVRAGEEIVRWFAALAG